MIHTSPLGIAIMSEENSNQLLLYNQSLSQLLNDKELVLPSNTEPISEEGISHRPLVISQSLLNLKLKEMSEKEVMLAEQIKLPELIKNSEKNLGEKKYVLDIKEEEIEIKINKITFDDQSAKIITFIDCSYKNKVEKANHENRLKTQLISTISHEIRTPISAVLCSLDIMAPYIPAEVTKTLEIARFSCEMVIFHINDLTDYGKMSQTDIVLAPKMCDLNHIISNCIDLLSIKAAEKKIDIIYNQRNVMYIL